MLSKCIIFFKLMKYLCDVDGRTFLKRQLKRIIIISTFVITDVNPSRYHCSSLLSITATFRPEGSGFEKVHLFLHCKRYHSDIFIKSLFIPINSKLALLFFRQRQFIWHCTALESLDECVLLLPVSGHTGFRPFSLSRHFSSESNCNEERLF